MKHSYRMDVKYIFRNSDNFKLPCKVQEKASHWSLFAEIARSATFN